MTKTKSKAEPGTVIHGTALTRDLIPAFLSELGKHDAKAANRITEEIPRDVITPWGEVWGLKGRYAVVAPDDHPWWDSEDAIWVLNEDLFEAMDDIAPDGHHFGSHEGDGSDYGFWPIEEEEEE